jgi:hypothetical protein
MEARTELHDLLYPILITNRPDGLVAEIAREAGRSESLVNRWTKPGKEEPRLADLQAIVRVLRRRNRSEEAQLVLDAMTHETGAQAAFLPEEDAPSSPLERLSEAGEHVFRAMRAVSNPLQYRAHVWSAQRALQSARLAVGA